MTTGKPSATLLPLLLLILSACASEDEQFAETVSLGAPGSVICPPVSILPLTGSIAVFEENKDEILYRASLDSANITCIAEENALPQRADISFTGVAETERARIITGELPVFLTVINQQNRPLGKRVERLPVVLTSELNKIAYRGDFKDMPIPDIITPARQGLRFLLGFQLDEQQLRHNRTLLQQETP